MGWMSEDITFCVNVNCTNIKCRRNPKNIKLNIPHSFSRFEQCENWDEDGVTRMKKKDEEHYGERN